MPTGCHRMPPHESSGNTIPVPSEILVMTKPLCTVRACHARASREVLFVDKNGAEGPGPPSRALLRPIGSGIFDSARGTAPRSAQRPREPRKTAGDPPPHLSPACVSSPCPCVARYPDTVVLAVSRRWWQEWQGSRVRLARAPRVRRAPPSHIPASGDRPRRGRPSSSPPPARS